MAGGASVASDVGDLQEVDPTPVLSPMEEKRRMSFAKRSQPIHLHGSHGPSYYLSRIQRYSSYTFTVFAAMHLTNTALIPLFASSISSADSYLLLTRPYYQSAVAEPLLVLLPLGAHIASGVALRLYRRAQHLRRFGASRHDETDWRWRLTQGWPRLSGISFLGYLLAPLLAGHAYLNRLHPLLYDGGSSNVGLEYVAHGFARHPWISLPAFAVLIGVASWHFAWGWARWMAWTPSYVPPGAADAGLQRTRRWYFANIASTVLAGVWVGGMCVVGRGGAATGWVGTQFDELYRKIPIVGKWL